MCVSIDLTDWRINKLLLPHNLNLFSGAKHILLSSQRPFHFLCSIGALFFLTRQIQCYCSLLGLNALIAFILCKESKRRSLSPRREQLFVTNKWVNKRKRNIKYLSNSSKFNKSGLQPPIWQKTGSKVLFCSGDHFDIKKFANGTRPVSDIFIVNRKICVQENSFWCCVFRPACVWHMVKTLWVLASTSF